MRTLRDIAKDMRGHVREYLEQLGDCDHKVGICRCYMKRVAEEFDEWDKERTKRIKRLAKGKV